MDVLEFVDAKKYIERYLLECQCSKQHCIEQGDLDSAKEFEHQESVLIEMLKQMELEQKATE